MINDINEMILFTGGSFKEGELELTFAQPKASVGVEAVYAVRADVMMVGSSGKIYVTTAEGKYPGPIEVYQYVSDGEDVLVGKTNTRGVLQTNKFCQIAGEEYTIYAKKGDDVSFLYTGTTNSIGNVEVTPTNIRLNAVEDSATTQSITWFSAPEYTLEDAVVEYVTAKEYESGSYSFVSETGVGKVYDGFEENEATYIKTVTLGGLEEGTTYYYRVGDGVDGHWSDVQTFTTSVAGADTSFFVMGDTQLLGNVSADADAIALLHQVADNVKQNDVSFGLQTGDYIDDAGSLEAWNEILSVFGEDYASLPIIQVLGNHEYYGNTSGSFAETIFDLPASKYYSVEYGNVYVAVINCNANVEEAAKWLVEDAKNTDCEWKVLSVHQPPYYTNPKGSSAAYNEYLPSAIDEAGIDAVFSGHDHAYARTEPLTGGEVDKEDGTVYFVCGDLGEKSRSSEYAPDNNPDFHFATISQDYDAVYLIVETEGCTMTITAHDADGTVIDSCTLDHQTDCEKNGGHTAEYDAAAKKVTCSVCGETLDAYTGIATDKETGKQMYFIGGVYKTGWFLVDTDLYHFGKDGLAHKVTSEKTEASCITVGSVKATCECGETNEMTFGQIVSHRFAEKTDENGNTYYECEFCGTKSDYDLPFIDVDYDSWYIEGVAYCFNNGIVNGATAITFNPDGELTREQLATILWRAEGSEIAEKETEYTDKPSSYAAVAVQWVSEVGLMNGYPDGTFGPQAKITREELVTVMYRYANLMGMDTSTTGDVSNFTDAATIQDWSKDAVSWAVVNNVVTGYPNGTFQPKGTATRAQSTTIMMRMHKAAEEAKAAEVIA